MDSEKAASNWPTGVVFKPSKWWKQTPSSGQRRSQDSQVVKPALEYHERTYLELLLTFFKSSLQCLAFPTYTPSSCQWASENLLEQAKRPTTTAISPRNTWCFSTESIMFLGPHGGIQYWREGITSSKGIEWLSGWASPLSIETLLAVVCLQPIMTW